MNSSKAFAPANISCIFKIYKHKNPRWMGSYGVGFTLNEGVIADVSIAKRSEIVFNNKSISFPTVKSVVGRLTKEKVKVYINTKLPLGCGFGLSGASALATSYAINNLLDLKRPYKELAIISHTAEVENKTGLGDVVNQFYGGFCLKLKPSSYFAVKKLPIDDINVYCRYFGKISTKSIVSNPLLRKKINEAATTALKKVQKLIKNKNSVIFGGIIRISKKFAVDSSLLKNSDTIKTIENIEKNNGNASMIMLGNAVFSDMPFENSLKFKITIQGAHIL